MLPTLTTKTVQVGRGSRGYGFILSNQAPCIVSSVTRNGPAQRAGIRVGDEILKVNSEDVSNATHEQVVRRILKCTSPGITLVIRTIDDQHSSTKHDGLPTQDITNSHEDVTKREQILRSVNKVVEDLHLQEMFSNTADTTTDSAVVMGKTKAFISNSSEGEMLNGNNNVDRHVDDVTLEIIRDDELVISPPLSPTSLDVEVFEPRCEFVVGYLCTIEIPRCSSLPSASLSAINDCVKRLQRSTQRVNTLVLMRLTPIGISLINSTGSEIVTYSAKSLAFSGVCPEDKKFFGLVTRKLDNDSMMLASSPSRSPKLLALSHKSWTCSCHVFVVEPNLSTHSVHQAAADSFDIQCSFSTDFGGCKEFPQTSAVISHAINSLYRPDYVDDEDLSSEASGSMTSLSTHSSLSLRSSADGGHTNGADKHRSKDAGTTGSSKDTKVSPKFSQSSYDPNESDGSEYGDDVEDDEGIIPYTKYLSQLKRHCQETAEMRDKQIENEAKVFSARNLDVSNSKSSFDSENVLSERSRRAVALGLGSETQDSTEYVGIKRPNARSSLPSLSYPAHSQDELWTRDNNGSIQSPARGRSNTDNQILSQSESMFEVSAALAHPRTISHTSLPNDTTETTSRVELWSKTFNRLLWDDIGLNCFLEFLKKEFSEENIRFWISCEKFKKITDKEKMKLEADRLFTQHLGPEANMLVNVDQPAVVKAEERLSCTDTNMFSVAQKQVYMLMKFDSYPRFLKSDLYRQCLVAEAEGTSLPFEIEAFGESNGRKVYINEKKPKLNNKENREPVDKKWSLLNFLSKGKPGKMDTFMARGRAASLGSISGGSSTESLPLALDEKEQKKLTRSHPFKNSKNGKNNQDAVVKTMSNSSLCQFCRVVLPNGASAVLMAEAGTSVRTSLQKLCSRQRLSFTSFDVFSGSDRKLIDLDRDIATLADCVIYLERMILFGLDLPNQRSVGVKAHPSKSLQDVVEPILNKNGFSIDRLVLHLESNKIPLSLDVSVSALENKRVVAHTVEQFDSMRRIGGPPPPVNPFNRKNSDTDNAFLNKADRGIVASRSSGMLDEFEHMKQHVPENTPRGGRSHSVDMLSATPRKLIESIGRLQAGRLDDQRGLLPRHIELPDFLKPPIGKQVSQRRRRDQGVSASFHTNDLNRPMAAVRSDSTGTTSSADRASLCSVQSWSGSSVKRDSVHVNNDGSRVPVTKSDSQNARLKRSSGKLSLEVAERSVLRRLSSGPVPATGPLSNPSQSGATSRITNSGVHHNSSQDSSTDSTIGHRDDKADSGVVSSATDDAKQHALFKRTSSADYKSYLRIRHSKTEKAVSENLMQWRNRTDSNDSTADEANMAPRFARSQSLDAETAIMRSPETKVQHRFSVANVDVASFRSPIRSTLLTIANRRPRPMPMTLDDLEAENILGKMDSVKQAEEVAKSPRTDRHVTDMTSSSSNRDAYSPVAMVTIGELDEMMHASSKSSGGVTTPTSKGTEGCIAVSPKMAGSHNEESVLLENKVNGIRMHTLNPKRHSSPGTLHAFQSPMLTRVDKKKLLSGETIFGQKNERITFV